MELGRNGSFPSIRNILIAILSYFRTSPLVLMANGLMFNEWFEFLQAISGVMPLIQSIFSVILALMASTAVHAEGLSKFDLECRGIDQVVAGGDGTETPKAWDMTISLDETQGIAFIHRAQVTV